MIIGLKKSWLRILVPVILVLVTIPVVPMGYPIHKQARLIGYFNALQEKYGLDVGRRFRRRINPFLPQDYADMLGWEELTMVTNKAWQMITDKRSAFYLLRELWAGRGNYNYRKEIRVT